MKLGFVQKDADKAYVSNRLWLPKSGIRVGPIKRALEFTVSQRGQQETYEMWDETKSHIICPREFLPPSEYPKYRFPFIDVRPQFERVEFEDLVSPRNEEQWKAWAAFEQNNNGILNLGCGKGKTKLAVKKIAQRGVPTLVIVPDGGILDQWQRSIYGSGETPPGLKFDGQLGIIQGQTFDWKRPVTLALITTLALRIRDNALPEEMYRYFGQVIYDEVHQVGAPMFSLTAGPFFGDRIGLTATVQREDGLDPVFRYHIGDPFYSDLSQDLIPDIYFQETPVTLDLSKAEVNGMTNMSLLRTQLGKDLKGNIFRYWAIKRKLDMGRKILVLSHSKAQLRLFHAMFPGSGLIVAETSREERTDILRNSKICFAITRLGSVGVDDDRLDTLFCLTPFRSKIALQQSMGRIQRFREGKAKPEMFMFEDWTCVPLRKMCSNVKSTLRSWGYAFNVVPPNGLNPPETLPPSVQAAYDAAFSALPEEQENEEDND